jgi:hypothetical protein
MCTFTAPQWTDNSHEAELTNTLIALTLAGVPVSNTSIDAVLDSLRKIVASTAAPAEAEIEFTLRPRNFLRQHIVEVPTSSGDSAILEVDLQDRPVLAQVLEVETVIFRIIELFVSLNEIP